MKARKSRGATKLKDMHLSSVDFCRQGANPDAYIKLHKSAESSPPLVDTRPPLERAIDLIKSTFKPVQKEAATFDDVTDGQEAREKVWRNMDALHESMASILNDQETEGSAKRILALQSLTQFNDAMTETIEALYPDESRVTADNVAEQIAEKINRIMAKSVNETEKGVNQMDTKDILKELDLSNLTEEEQAQMNDLLIKAFPPKKKKPMEEEGEIEAAACGNGKKKKVAASAQAQKSVGQEPVPAVEKSETGEETEIPDNLRKAIDHFNGLSARMEQLVEKQEKDEMLAVAKKYEALGEKPEELASRLYEVKKAGDKVYDTCIATLDRALEAVKKSDSVLLGEIGKSNHNYNAVTGTVAKAEEIAKGMMADGKMTYQQAMAKAWEQNPDLAAEYQKEYEGGMA